jgi:hypothetical protein
VRSFEDENTPTTAVEVEQGRAKRHRRGLTLPSTICLVLVVTFERVDGRGVDVHPNHAELMAIAADLERRGRTQLGERVRALALGDPASRMIVIPDADVPILQGAVESVSAAMALSDGWTRVREL